VRMVDQPVEDGIAKRGVPDARVPVLDRELAGDERGAASDAILDQFQEIAAFPVAVVNRNSNVLARRADPEQCSCHDRCAPRRDRRVTTAAVAAGRLASRTTRPSNSCAVAR
jgi:hypothetical protein